MDSLLDFYFGILVFVGYAAPFALVAWVLESWWLAKPRWKRAAILRAMRVK